MSKSQGRAASRQTQSGQTKRSLPTATKRGAATTAPTRASASRGGTAVAARPAAKQAPAKRPAAPAKPAAKAPVAKAPAVKAPVRPSPVAARTVPTVAAKSHFGNLGGGSGLVECVGSVLAMRHGELFPLLNHEVADEACGIRPARRGDPAGEVFVSTAVTPQGQSGSLVIRSWQDSA